jgi:hypothetical protein
MAKEKPEGSGTQYSCPRPPAWIPERSATRLREADLNILSEFGKQGLELRLEAEAFAGRKVGREDDLWIFRSDVWSISRWRGSHWRKRVHGRFSTPPFCHEA